MTRDQAIVEAQAYVAARYPMVPRVVSVTHLANVHGRLVGKSWFHFGGKKTWHETEAEIDVAAVEKMAIDSRTPIDFGAMLESYKSGKWSVSFFMSGDTDEQGMPLRLSLLIDDADGSIVEDSDESPRDVL